MRLSLWCDRKRLLERNHVGMEEICVTIGVCARNCANTIQEAIATIAGQGFPHSRMEVIVVDDGSTDNTLESIYRLVLAIDIRTTVFSQTWRGLGVARNVVVKNARGRYIIWVDSDMRLPEDHVEKQVEFMERNRKVGAAKARYGLVNSKSVVATLENSRGFFLRSESSNMVGTGGSIYRVEAIRDAEGFDEQIRGAGEDIDALIRIKKKGWLLSRTEAEFYERFKESWKDLWLEYYWWGYGARYVWHKHLDGVSIVTKLPPVTFLASFVRCIVIFRSYRKLTYLLLPLQGVFKDSAWVFGFLAAGRESLTKMKVCH